eukprot:5903957-Alexandrium_andersonii.AAC.1
MSEPFISEPLEPGPKEIRYRNQSVHAHRTGSMSEVSMTEDQSVVTRWVSIGGRSLTVAHSCPARSGE